MNNLHPWILPTLSWPLTFIYLRLLTLLKSSQKLLTRAFHSYLRVCVSLFRNSNGLVWSFEGPLTMSWLTRERVFFSEMPDFDTASAQVRITELFSKKIRGLESVKTLQKAAAW